MHLIPFLHSRRTQAFLDALASEVAAAARHRVRCRVEDRSVGMSLNVLRGYVRARAARPVRQQADARLHGIAGLSLAARACVIRKATERAVHLVVRDLAGLELAAAPSRKAA